MVRLELLYSARNHTELDEVHDELDALPQCPSGEREWKRALWTYRQLAGQGGAHHRAVTHADLLIAAAAEAAEVPVLHYDEDYERIARVTQQPIRWLADKGTLR